MANLKLFNKVSLQKQFDVLTSSLNFFDMSYLISGGAMLCVLTYIPCGFRKMVFHANHIFLTAILCLLLSYVLGIISWVVGKHVRNVVLYSCESNLSNDQDFCCHFDEIVASFSWENVPISKLFAINKEAAFTHMWMMHQPLRSRIWDTDMVRIPLMCIFVARRSVVQVPMRSDC